MPIRIECDLDVHYGFVWLQPPSRFDVELMSTMGGQPFGILGGAVPGTLSMMTGLHTGTVPFTFEVHDAQPALDDAWEDVVEVSFIPDDVNLVVMAFEDGFDVTLPELTSYRARFCATGMDESHAQDTRMDDDPVVDRYLLALWPAPVAAPALLRERSEQAAYWRSVAQKTPPPPTPEELAVIAHERAEAEQRQQAEAQARREAWRWGGAAPSPALRTGGGNAMMLAREDRALVDLLAAASVDEQRAIAIWACELACSRATRSDLDWGGALNALTAGVALPPPFNDHAAAWAALFPGPMEFTVTLGPLEPDVRQPIAPEAAALAAVLAAAESHPLAAACGAINQAAAGFENMADVFDAARARLG